MGSVVPSRSKEVAPARHAGHEHQQKKDLLCGWALRLLLHAGRTNLAC